jgi:hypothetical protein
MYNPFAPTLPYQQGPMMYQQAQQTQQVVRVNGENGARAYQIGPNGSALLLDESGTIVWLVTTDGAGYKTVGAYDITPHRQPAVPDYSDLETRIKKLEDMINGNTGNITAAQRKRGESDDDSD